MNISKIKKYTTKHRTFKIAPNNMFISVYIDGQLSGFIFNNGKVIRVDGKEIVSSEFFK